MSAFALSPSEIDARVVRMNAILSCVRAVPHAVVSRVLVTLLESLRSGEIDDLDGSIAAIRWASDHDDVFDALCNERQSWNRNTGEPLDEALQRMAERHLAAIDPTIVVAVGDTIEDAIESSDPQIGRDWLAMLAAACRYAWVWEILASAHRASFAMRRGRA